MTADIELPPIAVSPYTDRILAAAQKQDCADPLFRILEDFARANMEPLISENERLRAERDSFQRVGIAAQARADRLAEALRRQRDWWLASKGEAVSSAPGGLTRIDPGFIALCDAHVQQIDLALRDHDQEVGNG